jgi:electron transfer flavoprotein beta subunit
VTREVDAGLETLELDLPAVITTDLRLNDPRYVKLPEIMKAKKKPLDIFSLNDLTVVPTKQFAVSKVTPPPGKTKGVMVKDVTELVTVLKQKGVL